MVKKRKVKQEAHWSRSAAAIAASPWAVLRAGQTKEGLPFEFPTSHHKLAANSILPEES